MKEFILHLEALPCPWRILLTLDEFAHIGCHLIVVLNVIISILEIMELILILSML